MIALETRIEDRTFFLILEQTLIGREAMKKMAVIFPGIGYHSDKPLLYYSKKLVQKLGYEIVEVTYSGFPARILGDEKKMKESFLLAMEQTKERLKEYNPGETDDVLFISKSIGTAVAAAFAGQEKLKVRHVLFTPVLETFDVGGFFDHAVAFHGTADPWAETEEITERCCSLKIPLFIAPDGNHSLETGDVITDIRAVEECMKYIQEFLSGKS